MFEKGGRGLDPEQRQATIAELRRKLASDPRWGGGAAGAVSAAEVLPSRPRSAAAPVPPTMVRPAESRAPEPRPAEAAEVEPSGRPDGYLPVVEALTPLFPGGGLPRGGVVAMSGRGVTSLLYTLLAGPGAPWAALVGWTDLGLRAAAEIGVDLNRLVLVPDPGEDVLQVLSVLADGVDVLAVRVPGASPGSPARLRVLQGRLRQRGTVLLAVGSWPGADLTLDVSVESWLGLGRGHGRLRGRELQIHLSGRGAAGRGCSTRLLLTADRQGRVIPTIGAASTAGAAATGPAAAAR